MLPIPHPVLRSVAVLPCLALLCAAVPAAADPVADFYKGKEMRIVIQSGAGGGYDTYARLVARHMIRHIPGEPATITPVNMPGGGGIRSFNYVATTAPRDGTALGMLNQGLPMYQALDGRNLEGDARRLHWIGNVSNSNQVLAVWHTHGIRSIEDAKKREVLLGATGAGSIAVQLPAAYNAVLGTRFKVIVGYTSAGEMNMAMERGETHGRGTNPIASYIGVTPHYIAENRLNILVQTGLQRDPAIPDVPLFTELAEGAENKAIAAYISKAVAVGRPIATTPEVPKERVDALRRAFDRTLEDAAFKEEAAKQRLEINAMSGEELQQLVEDVVGAPRDIVEKVAKAIVPDRIEKRAAAEKKN